MKRALPSEGLRHLNAHSFEGSGQVCSLRLVGEVILIYPSLFVSSMLLFIFLSRTISNDDLLIPSSNEEQAILIIMLPSSLSTC
jgi:hypothetical protein